MPSTSNSSSSSSSEDSQRRIAATRSHAQIRRRKRDIRRSRPLDTGVVRSRRQPPAKGISSEAVWLRECESLYKKLPKQSRYAQHKLKCCSKAISYLKRARADRTAAEAAELQELLCSLNIVAVGQQQQQQEEEQQPHPHPPQQQQHPHPTEHQQHQGMAEDMQP